MPRRPTTEIPDKPKTRSRAEKVQFPKVREIYTFESLEVFQISLTALVIARDGAGRKLGVFPLEAKIFFEPEDALEHLKTVEAQLADPETQAEMRESLIKQQQEAINGTGNQEVQMPQG